ncbi:UdgX family uracil-DNA binding protein [Streptomyces sp. NPDC056002]|uniref:UdgX family uracil-DNA binding protein n=1 Tax=Streptomyces sp. NPDC056002 TaxID=3345675 RepID=UPI0035D63F66
MPHHPQEAHTAAPYLPERGGLPTLRRAAARCQGCPLHENATQTVFGVGTRSARIMLIGEQPGDQEDVQGHPFVGPAGRLLHKALDELGIEEGNTYLTNAVKHFKFSQEGPSKRRIHKAPDLHEMTACRPWLVAELKAVDPDVVVALGATAGKTLLGSSFRVSEQRGILLPAPSWDELGHSPDENGTSANDRRGNRSLVCTIHPSAVLRADDRKSAYAGLLSDLGVAAAALA